MSKSFKELSKFSLSDKNLKDLKGGANPKKPTGGGNSGLPPGTAEKMSYAMAHVSWFK